MTSEVIAAKLRAAQSGRKLPRRWRTETVKLTVAELREIAADNPSHDVAQVYHRATAGKDPTRVLMVDRVDVEAVMKDRPVVVVDRVATDDNGNEYIQVTKVLGEATDGE